MTRDRRGRAAPGPVAARLLAARVRRGLARGFGAYTITSRAPQPFRDLAAALWAAPGDGPATRILARVADEAAENPYGLRELMASFAGIGTGDYGERREPDRTHPLPLPRPVVSFLTAPVTGARHSPGVRCVKYLDGPEFPLPGPSHWRHADVAAWIADATDTEDDGTNEDFGPLTAVLAGTDQPELLSALQGAFASGVGVGTYLAQRPDAHETRPLHRLWHADGTPTLLTRVVTANPHLPDLGPEPDGEPPWYTSAPVVLLAVLKERLDLVEQVVRRRGPHGTVASLRTGVAIAAPATFTDGCRRALRRLEHPVARDDVCRAAVAGDPEMRAAAVDAGYAPSWLDEDGRLAYVFATEQWERYDAEDPDGRRLRAHVAAMDKKAFSRMGDGHDAVRENWSELRRALHIAALNGRRPSPVPPPPKNTGRPAGSRPLGPLGSWPTSYTGGFGTTF